MKKEKTTKMNRLKKEYGITLIALVITIIVLLILAGVAISTLTGNNGLLEKTQYAAEQMEVAKFKDEAGLAYMELYSQNAQNQNYVVSEDDWVSLLQSNYGYTIGQSGGDNYVELNGMYYPISLSGSNIIVGEGTQDVEITPVGGGSEPEEPAVTYTVTFNTNGGSSVDAQTVQSGGKATRPATNPTKSGWAFAGWFSNAGLTTPYDFNTTINSDTTIYAKWAKSLTITYGDASQYSLEIIYDEGMTWGAWAASSYAHDLKSGDTENNVVFRLVSDSYPTVGNVIDTSETISESVHYELKPSGSGSAAVERDMTLMRGE